MINALITGRLIHIKTVENQVEGRIVLDGDKPVQFTARRGVVKTALLAMACGMPLSVAGPLTSRVKYDKDGKPYVCSEIVITSVLTAQPQRLGLFGSILKG